MLAMVCMCAGCPLSYVPPIPLEGSADAEIEDSAPQTARADARIADTAIVDTGSMDAQAREGLVEDVGVEVDAGAADALCRCCALRIVPCL
jgi:hypothetical protein